MRYLILLVLGIVVGAACAAIGVNTISRRDAYPRGVMNVMQHQLMALKQDERGGHCDAKSTRTPLAILRDLAEGVELTFYADDTADAPFREYSQRLRDAVVLASDANDCPALVLAVDKIGAACEACHHQYR
jgi:cytochrome c556